MRYNTSDTSVWFKVGVFVIALTALPLIVFTAGLALIPLGILAHKYL